jgi:hypothetical protein
LLEVLLNFLQILSAPVICYVCYSGLKLIVTIIICRHPELSDEKVKHITRMFSKHKHHLN